jgi:hypothetical protein
MLGALAIASWVPWAWALLAACLCGLLLYFNVASHETSNIVVLICLAIFGALMLYLAGWAVRITWIDAPRGKGWVDCIVALPILVLGHACAALAALVAFLMLYGLFIAIGTAFSP